MAKKSHLWTYAAILGGAGLLYYFYRGSATTAVSTSTASAGIDPTVLSTVQHWGWTTNAAGTAAMLAALIPSEYNVLSDMISKVWVQGLPITAQQAANWNFLVSKYHLYG